MAKRSALPGDLRTKFIAALTGIGLDADRAAAAAKTCVSALIDYARGDQLYVPVCDIDERDWQIWDEFTGSNHIELARKYSTSERNIYLIIDRMRALHTQRTQPTLPGVD